MAESPNQTVSPLRITPLGGLGEIGKNTWIFQVNDEIMLLDGGLSFPTEEMHGVNLVLPNIDWLIENQEKIVGMVVTHGHEDHIGGIPYHLQRLRIPVIHGPRLALALLEDKLREAELLGRTQLQTVGPRGTVRVGKYFVVEYLQNTHSMADSYTLAIHTPTGLVIHTGDFKFDHTPVDGRKFDYQRLAEHGEKGVLCLISDSTNAEVPGFTPSERSVYPNLERYIKEAPGRVIVTTFASSVHRIHMLLDIAQKTGRSVCVVGRSMLNMIAKAKALGFIPNFSDSLLQPVQAANSLPAERVLVLTTGSQGEPMSALTRIAGGDHRQVKIQTGDTVIFSSNPIPGNTISVVRVIDKLMQLGANVIYGRERGIHVSGHGAIEDQKLMLALTKPKFFFPCHGEYRMIRRHAQTAQEMGVPAENMLLTENGDVVELTAESMRVVDRIPAGVDLVDASRSTMVNSNVLRERQRLAEDGFVTVAVALTAQGTFAARPQISIKAVARSAETRNLEDMLRTALERTQSRFGEFRQPLEAGALGYQYDWMGIKQLLERTVKQVTREMLQSHPLIQVLLQTPLEAPVASLPLAVATSA
ncbi:MAG: ribonuclease J [Aphanocapsa lilacina HA4352-LM1]|jgi:ribonuclease J|nr:ribonuclease J [Aphanocapsa lilacina HA4352-LM1]